MIELEHVQSIEFFHCLNKENRYEVAAADLPTGGLIGGLPASELDRLPVGQPTGLPAVLMHCRITLLQAITVADCNSIISLHCLFHIYLRVFYMVLY